MKQNDFKSFLPSDINTAWEWQDSKISILLEKASAELGGLNSFSELIPNIDVYIKMHIRTEANKSSKIEGTNTSIKDDMLSVQDIAPEKRNDHEEVNNYIKALNYGIKRIVDEYKSDVAELSGKTSNYLSILNAFFETPLLGAKDVQAHTGLHKATVDRAIKIMLEKGLIDETTGYERNRIYVLSKYYSIFALDEEYSKEDF